VIGKQSNFKFSAKRLDRIALMELWHFWFVGRCALIKSLLEKYTGNKPQSILDIGCGTGLMPEILAKQEHRLVGVDLRPEGLALRKSLYADFRGIQADAGNLPFKNNIFDVVLLLDILEHADDKTVLSEVKRIQRMGGLALITVPAIPWLWSRRDENAGHRRRYTRKKLFYLLNEIPLTILTIRYYQFFLFPLIVISRLLGRKWLQIQDREEHPPAFMNKTMCLINQLEISIGNWMLWPWGSSLVAVTQKKG